MSDRFPPLRGHPAFAVPAEGLRVFRLGAIAASSSSPARGIARLTAERASLRSDLARGRERLSPGNERQGRGGYFQRALRR